MPSPQAFWASATSCDEIGSVGDAPPLRKNTLFAARTGAKGESASALAAVNKAMTSFTLTGAIVAGCVRGLRAGGVFARSDAFGSNSTAARASGVDGARSRAAVRP